MNINEEVSNYNITYSHEINDKDGRRLEQRTATVSGRSKEHAHKQFINSSAAKLAGFKVHSVEPSKGLDTFMKESLDDDRKLIATYRRQNHLDKAKVSMAGGRLSNYHLALAHSNQAKIAKINGDKEREESHSKMAALHKEKYRKAKKNDDSTS